MLVPVAAALSLFACNRPDPVSTGPNAVSGSARVVLPALPVDYLPAGATAVFRLDITGPDMSPMYAAETLYVGKTTTMEVDGIPPGNRVFHGVLYRLDSTGLDTAATHEGSAYAAIQSGATANVALFLKSTATGSAHVCLLVEGWPMDSSCIEPPPPPRYPNLAGCYALTVTKHGPKEDTLFQAKLSISQFDSSLFAVTTWKSGAKDSATGFILLGDTGFYLGSNPSQFIFKGIADSGSGSLRGYFQNNARGISGDAIAVPAPCDSVVVPVPDSSELDTVRCWAVQQTTVDGRMMTGELWAGWRDTSMQAWFQWSNVAAFGMDNGSIPAQGSTLYLFGTLPGGFAHPARSALEMGHYKAKIAANGMLQSGAAYARAGSTDYTSADKFADWTGSPIACPERARAVIAGRFN
jgi:hypothetical protein